MSIDTTVRPDVEHLLAQARAGDGVALGRLLEMFRGYLALLARLQIGRRLQGKVDPADVVQETFLEAHRDFAGFRGTSEGEIVGWLRQVLARNLTNVVRHYQGTQRRDPRLERELRHDLDQSSRALDRALAAAQSSPSQQAARREQAVLLAESLATLPNDYREVLVLRHLELLPFAEVARRMGRSKDSVMKLWARGLAQLRRTLGGSHERDDRSPGAR